MTVADRLAPFAQSTIFARMTRRAQETGAVNLGQGFPDFDGPSEIMDAARDAMARGRNQYARMAGESALCEAIADRWARDAGGSADPDTEVSVTCGATEGIAATLLGLVNPGDEVVLFEPYYDSYRACLSMCGATPRFVALRAPDFTFDEAELRSAFTARTKAVLLNTPHNPTGRVFSREELEAIAALAREHGAMVIADEVYDRFVYEGEHVSIATLDGMRERTVTLNSIGKTYSLTGWKVGWAIAPPEVSRAIRAAHQYLTFCVATPLQHAAAAALGMPAEYERGLLQRYGEARSALLRALEDAGLRAFAPQGSYFVLAEHAPLGAGDDLAACEALIERAGVVSVPVSVFCERKDVGRDLVRFAFCKRSETLRDAAGRLRRLRPAETPR